MKWKESYYNFLYFSGGSFSWTSAILAQHIPNFAYFHHSIIYDKEYFFEGITIHVFCFFLYSPSSRR